MSQSPPGVRPYPFCKQAAPHERQVPIYSENEPHGGRQEQQEDEIFV